MFHSAERGYTHYPKGQRNHQSDPYPDPSDIRNQPSYKIYWCKDKPNAMEVTKYVWKDLKQTALNGPHTWHY